MQVRDLFYLIIIKFWILLTCVAQKDIVNAVTGRLIYMTLACPRYYHPERPNGVHISVTERLMKEKQRKLLNTACLFFCWLQFRQ